MLRRPETWLALLLTLLAASGATCVPRPPLNDPLAPAAFVAPPTLDEVLTNLHATSQRITTLHSDSASVAAPGLPNLRATLTLEKPRRFRLQARLIGPAVDLGSNDTGLWFWASSDPQQAVYVARHEQLVSAGATPYPLDATWLIQAFGLVDFQPVDRHEGPWPRSDGSLEIRSYLPRPSGMLQRSLVIDATYGWVVEQTIWDANGQQLVHVRASQHRYQESAAVSLPHRIEIHLPPAQLSLAIEVGTYSVNQLPAEGPALWEMPPFEGLRRISLAAADGGGTRAVIPLGTDPGFRGEDRMAFRPRVRGYQRVR
jgi:hypothetical protein